MNIPEELNSLGYIVSTNSPKESFIPIYESYVVALIIIEEDDKE